MNENNLYLQRKNEERKLFLQRINKTQKEFLESINININEDLVDIEEKLYEYMQLNGINKDDEINEIGLKCEEILDILADTQL